MRFANTLAALTGICLLASCTGNPTASLDSSARLSAGVHEASSGTGTISADPGEPVAPDSAADIAGPGERGPGTFGSGN